MNRKQRLAVLAKGLAKIASSLAVEAALTPKEQKQLMKLLNKDAGKLNQVQRRRLEAFQKKMGDAAFRQAAADAGNRDFAGTKLKKDKTKDQDGPKLEDSEWKKLAQNFNKQIVKGWPKAINNMDESKEWKKDILDHSMPQIKKVAQLIKNKAKAKQIQRYIDREIEDELLKEWVWDTIHESLGENDFEGFFNHMYH